MHLNGSFDKVYFDSTTSIKLSQYGLIPHLYLENRFCNQSSVQASVAKCVHFTLLIYRFGLKDYSILLCVDLLLKDHKKVLVFVLFSHFVKSYNSEYKCFHLFACTSCLLFYFDAAFGLLPSLDTENLHISTADE